MARPSLLFLCPIRPLLTGNGAGLRAGAVLEALAAVFDVSLLVIPVMKEPAEAEPLPWPGASAALDVEEAPDYQQISTIRDPRLRMDQLIRYPKPAPLRFVTSSAVSASRRAFQEKRFDVVHVYRLFLAPFADLFLTAPRNRPACWLDLDEMESHSHRRQSVLHEAAGDAATAEWERAETAKYAQLEQQYLPLFDRVFVCSEKERAAAAPLCPDGQAVVLPNAVRLPTKDQPRKAKDPFTFLFAGSLNYYPNQDAVAFFCGEVLPILRKKAPAPFRVVIAGWRPPAAVRDLASASGASLVANARDVSALYRDADAVVVPVRAGGGTRFQVLEAFRWRRPVVATPTGAEGFAAAHESELLIGQSGKEFAAQCLRLMKDAKLGQTLAGNGWDCLRRRHTIDAIREILAAHFRSAPDPA